MCLGGHRCWHDTETLAIERLSGANRRAGVQTIQSATLGATCDVYVDITCKQPHLGSIET